MYTDSASAGAVMLGVPMGTTLSGKDLQSCTISRIGGVSVKNRFEENVY